MLSLRERGAADLSLSCRGYDSLGPPLHVELLLHRKSGSWPDRWTSNHNAQQPFARALSDLMSGNAASMKTGIAYQKINLPNITSN